MRIFVGPVEISGIAASLVQSFVALGERAELVLRVPHPYAYGRVKTSPLLRVWQAVGAARANCRASSFLKKAVLVLLHRVLGWICFFLSIGRYDVYLFTFGCTFTDSWLELAIIRFFKKRIFFVYFGSESRPPFMDGAQMPQCVDRAGVALLHRLATRTRARVRRQERFADFLISSPAAGHYHSRPFINWFSLGVPVGAVSAVSAKAVSAVGGGSSRPVRILHSPSNAIVKGTQFIESAIEVLVAKGYSIEFVRLSGVPNAVVLEELQRCDFVVDQVFSDTPMAVFAAEAAKYGKAAIVAGYFSEVISNCLPKDDIPPVLFVSPDELVNAVERLVVDSAYREQLGSAARKFVDDRWDPLVVAKRYLSVIRGDFPKEWCVDPYKISYVYGGGLSKARLKFALTKYVHAFGFEALGFDDKPLLKSKVSQLINEEEGGADA